MSRLTCERAKRRVKPKIQPHWIKWCVEDELGLSHAVNEEGNSMEYVILSQGPLAIKFHPGMKIRHRDGNTLNNRRANLAIEVVDLPPNLPAAPESRHDID